MNILAQDTLAFYNFEDNDVNIFSTGATGLNGGRDNRTSWEVGVPRGGRGYDRLSRPRQFVGNPDPTTDHTSENTVNFVAGQGIDFENRRQGISGHYNNSSEWFQIPVLNCTKYYNIQLSFWQWGNLEPNYDFAFVEVSNDGLNWEIVYQPESLEQTAWERVSINISNYANNNPEVYIRWRTESDQEIFYSGWNIDDITITGDLFLNDGDSYIQAGSIATPETISSLTDSYNERISILDFTITDAGSGDNLPTLIDTLVISPNNSNTIINWKNAIAGASLYDTDSHIEQIGKVRQDKIFFTNSSLLTVLDGSSRNYILRIYLKADLSQIKDNDRIGLTINYANFSINLNGSFIDNGIISTSDNNLNIDIDATALKFITLPEQLVEANRMLTPIIEVAGVDENGNIDQDFSGSIQINNSENLTTANNHSITENGSAVFSSFFFEESGGPVVLTAISDNPAFNDAVCPVTVTISESISENIFFDNFDESGITGWTSGVISGDNSWETGEPNGGYGFSFYPGNIGLAGNPDPYFDFTTDNNINYVYGQGLGTTSAYEGKSGYYNNSNDYLISPAINCTDYYNTQLIFKRWANVEADYDEAYLEISTDGTDWTLLDHELYPEDESWTTVNIDISSFADRQTSVYIRWRVESDESIFYSGWNIDDVTITGIYSPTNTWTGTVSDEWSNPGNWSSNTVPHELSSVIIDAGTAYSPVVYSQARCKEIVIKIGAALAIEQTGNLEVFGDFTIETSSNGFGAVIEDNNLIVHGQGFMARYLQNSSWDYVSSPFQNISSNLFGSKIYSYNEPLASDNWSYGWEVAVNENLQPGKGYDVYKNVDTIINMEGEFNSGTIEQTLSYTDGIEIEEHEGWNLVGNPYPSSIDWDAASGWTKTNICDAIYIWDEEKQNFVTYVSGTGVNGGSRYIPPMQGFFVKVNSPGTGTLRMTNEVRNQNGGIQLKVASGFKNELKFKVTGSAYSDETVVRFKPYANIDFDQNLDANKKFSTNPAVPQLFSLDGNENPLTINTLPEKDEYQTVLLYQNIQTEGKYTLQVEGISSFDYSKTVYLEDLELDSLIDLTETQEYKYYSKSIQNNARFKLHIGMPLTIEYQVKHVGEDAVDDGEIDIRVLGGVQPILSIEWSNGSISEDLYDIQAGEYTVNITDNNFNTCSETIVVRQTISKENLTDIQTNQDNAYNRIYGFGNQLFVKTIAENVQTSDIVLLDLNGKVIYQDNTTRYGNFVLDLNLSKGLYIVHLTNNGQIHSEKIIIE
jgi:hypothetical protein